jgi:GT2 family glycosyltransferase
MKVAAIIPHWNRADLLESLLGNLRSQTRPFNRIIVADNGSVDGSAELAGRAGAEVVRLPRNFGFAAAVNRGVAAAGDADWVAILNNDARLEPGWLETLLAAVRAKQACFATGKTLQARDPSRIDGAWDEISRGACPLRCGAGAPDGPFWNRPRTIRVAPMTAMLVDRAAFQKLGGLDERFESYLEDVDFGLRCALAGLTGIYEPKAVAYHYGSSTWGRWHPDAIRLQARNQVLLVAKHFRGQRRWPILAGQLLWGLVALGHGSAWPYLKGKLEGLRLARRIRSEGAPPEAVAALLKASEREIVAIQKQTGPERYWRLYFLCAPLRP